MKLDASKIKNILVVSLSNLGDVILTFPVVDILKENFPVANLHVVVGPKAKSFFKDNPHIAKVHIFNKHDSGINQLRWVLHLRKEQFDLAVDLRNTAIPILAGAKCFTPLWTVRAKHMHMKQKHLNRLKTVFQFARESKERYALFISDADKKYIDILLRSDGVAQERFIAVGPGAANTAKRWPKESFAQVCDRINQELKIKIVFVGDQADKEIAKEILGKMKTRAVNACGSTSLTQLAALLSRACLTLVNDSAIMHMASYLDVPTLAIFGPTDPAKYGPWGTKAKVIQRDIYCVPCEKSGCQYGHECMSDIQPSEVYEGAKVMING
ncbi:MAG TPA: glycosyltransferase family 9 protein [Candidatus Omnitrophota bacterium]|nr:glycosyltransferase family 9 protein [Candidatus Omnitrophota bacterium]HPD84980.1 glycosyltransferase family 9 protein [Candidatus Omnitrophota bacterium]HRZ03838.1 glycosyltransferase family 9 protein [Candidatus Omnitrophota bacterium]